MGAICGKPATSGTKTASREAFTEPTQSATHFPLRRLPAADRIPPHSQPASADPALLAIQEHDESTSTAPVAFYATFGVGTPPQERVLLCDTGSANTWAAFDSSKDTSWSAFPKDKSFFFTQYGSGFALGTLGTTILSVGGSAVGSKLCVGCVEGEHKTGILGLGFQGLASGSAETVLGSWAAPNIFAIRMTSNAGGAGGQLSIGGWDPKLLPKGESSIEWVPTIDVASTAAKSPRSYWMVGMAKLEAMTNASVSYTKAFADTESVTILDTGDSLIMLPQAVLEDLFPKSKGFLLLNFGAAKGQVSLGANTLADCPNVRFTLANGTERTLAPAQYIDPLNPRLTMFKASPEPATFGPALDGATGVNILGHAFLEHMYTIWDAQATPPRVGFAPLS